MALDRGTLAKVDRRILSELDHTEGVQLVKVPVCDAVWSTWRRYCEALGMSLGRDIAILIAHELTSVAQDDFEHRAELLAQRSRNLGEWEKNLDERARSLGKDRGTAESGWIAPPFEPD